MDNNDIRWQQRFANYRKALTQLKKFIDKGELNELEEQGLIQAFEYTYELAWNVLKDYYEYQGETSIQGSRDAFRMAAKRGLVENIENWMDMVDSRNKTTHTYNEEIAEEIASSVIDRYFDLFKDLEEKMEVLKSRN